MKFDWDSSLKAAHENAFNVALMLPEHSQMEFACLFDQLLETGASFDEAKITLQLQVDRLQASHAS